MADIESSISDPKIDEPENEISIPDFNSEESRIDISSPNLMQITFIKYEDRPPVNMGNIYMITNTVNNKLYIGQTINSLKRRMQQHMANFNMYRKGRNDKIANFAIYKAMLEHGYDKFTARMLMTVPIAKLNELEQHFIIEFDTINNGYNLTNGGIVFHHHADSINLMREAKLGDNHTGRNEVLKGMPSYLSYLNDAKDGEAIHVKNHPLCTDKRFSVKTYGSIEAVKAAVLEFLTALEAAGVQYEHTDRKTDLDLPKGVCTTKNGYRINKMHKGKNYTRYFETKTMTREQNKARALEYHATLMIELSGK